MGGEEKSPGKPRVVPYTISADVHDRSSLRVAQIHRRTIGRSSTQLLLARCAFRPVLRCLWVVCCDVEVCSTKEVHEGIPKIRLELLSLIRGDCRWNTKA